MLTNSRRLVLWRLFHGGLPLASRIHWYIPVCVCLSRVHIDDVADICPPPSYLNNPEVMSGAAFFGLALVSGSKFVLSVAVIRYLAHWWFLQNVEKQVHSFSFHGDIWGANLNFSTVLTCANCMATPFVRKPVSSRS